jgi:hypothetical protein
LPAHVARSPDVDAQTEHPDATMNPSHGDARREPHHREVHMTKVPRHGDLEITQDLEFQRRDWRAQRIGWGIMLLLIVAAIAGVFGHGPVAKHRVRTLDGRLEVQYDRIIRHASEIPLRLRILPAPVRDTLVEVWISNAFIRGLIIERIEPEPLEEHVAEDGLLYRFRVADPSRPSDIVFHVEPDQLWRRRGAIGLVAGDTVRFTQYVLP